MRISVCTRRASVCFILVKKSICPIPGCDFLPLRFPILVVHFGQILLFLECPVTRRKVTRRKWKFAPREVGRAIKIAQDAGLQVTKVAIAADGAIIIGTGKPGENDAAVNENEWNEVYGKDQATPLR
jgi:hypothetical protein